MSTIYVLVLSGTTRAAALAGPGRLVGATSGPNPGGHDAAWALCSAEPPHMVNHRVHVYRVVGDVIEERHEHFGPDGYACCSEPPHWQRVDRSRLDRDTAHGLRAALARAEVRS